MEAAERGDDLVAGDFVMYVGGDYPAMQRRRGEVARVEEGRVTVKMGAATIVTAPHNLKKLKPKFRQRGREGLTSGD